MRIFLSIVTVSICTFFILSLESFGGESDTFVPWTFHHRSEKALTSRSPEVVIPSYASHIAISGLKFFIDYISRVDGDRCPMYPTCSSYSMNAMRKHGFLIGFVMTADRLIHESSEMDYAPLVKVGNRYRYSDPLSHNDYWWSSSNASSLDKM